ncbi:hypothetical protein LSH36_431g02004 [Paralvinella palmiformis]|uniref:Uncharacterized protein n=1 Tax=Paralvinella palmiformis TaxID=53620 RepID=A0AAD9JBB1_9ANNE|nr:hypothetical protein LSH36_431g02004 [Paralvinella palmiformis]
MTITIILLGLITLAGAFPENGRQRHSLLQRVLAEYYPHAVRDDKTCLQLAEISRSCINYALINPYSFPFTLGTNAVSYFGQITFGFDILNDKSAWQKFTCNIAEAHTVKELKTILDSQNDFNFGIFRLIYDYYAVGYAFSVFGGSVRRTELETLKTIGLLSVDPEVMRYMAGEAAKMNDVEFDMEDYLNGPTMGNVRSKCEALQDLVWNVMPLEHSVFKKAFLSWTGINLEDKDRVNTLLCDIVISKMDPDDSQHLSHLSEMMMSSLALHVILQLEGTGQVLHLN